MTITEEVLQATAKLVFEQYQYIPTNQTAAQWLYAAHAHIRRSPKNQGAFKGNGGHFNPKKNAIEKGLLEQDSILQILDASESISLDQERNFIHRLFCLNDKSHFPLVALNLEGVGLITPPPLIVVAQEYKAQMDEVARLYREFLSIDEPGGKYRWKNENLEIFFNPGSRVSPQEYVDWLNSRPQPGPQKRFWHDRIATRIQFPDVLDTWNEWNNNLVYPYILADNRLVRSKEPINRGKTQRTKPKNNPRGGLTPRILETDDFDIKSFFRTIRSIGSHNRIELATRSARDSDAALDVIKSTLSSINSKTLIPDVNQLKKANTPEERHVAQKEIEGFSVFLKEWSKAFLVVNLLAMEQLNKNLFYLEPDMKKQVALGSVEFINIKALEKNPFALKYARKLAAFVSKDSNPNVGK